MLKVFLLERESWEVCENVFVGLELIFLRVNGFGIFIVVLKLGEVLVIFCFVEEYFGSEIYVCVLFILGLVKFFLEISDFIENVDVFVFCIVVCGCFEVNDFKWESVFVLKDVYI